MQTVNELDLSFLPIEEPAFAQDPFPHFRAARERHPWLARCSIGYIVTDYKAMKELMRHDEKIKMGLSDIVTIMGAAGTPWGNFISGTIQDQIGPVHKRLRDALLPAFTPRQANLHRGLMREVISKLLDEWAPKGEFDFEEFASYFPITVMCRMLGASPDVIPRLRTSLEALGLAFSMDRKYLPVLQEGVQILDDFVRGLVAARRRGERLGNEPDLLDRLIAITDEGSMSEEELYNLLIFLFGAGYDTSKNVLTLIMHVLLDRPEVYARCAEDIAYCRKVMNETFRFHSPSSATRRVLEDIVFRGVVFPAGTLIMFPWSVSGRCPSAVANPDEFDPERPEANTHLAFGLGAHICLGQFIARAQIEEGLHLIAQRIKNPRRAGKNGWRPFPGVWGIAGLPIQFDVEAATASRPATASA